MKRLLDRLPYFLIMFSAIMFCVVIPALAYIDKQQSNIYYFCAVYTEEGMRFSDGSFDKNAMIKSVRNHCGMPANYTAVLLQGIDKEEAIK